MNHSKDDGTTPLHAAVHEEDTEAIKRLLEAGARIDLAKAPVKYPGLTPA